MMTKKNHAIDHNNDPTNPLNEVEEPMQQNFKGYLRYKTILCHKVALDV